MCEFIKFIEKQHKIEDSKNTIQHTKHYLDDELVQTSFENLVKKPRVDSAKVDTTVEDDISTGKFIYFIEVNGKVYNISKPKLEPKSILLKINEIEFRTKFNENTETLVYLDKLDYFELIFDYLQGYPVENIQYIFNGNENNFDDTIENKKNSNLEKFILLVHRLKMYNLLDKIYELYSYIYLYDFAILCNKNTITKIEPENILLSPQYKYHLKHYFYHNRDINIFKKYFMKYILGLQDLQTTITNLLKLRDSGAGAEDTPENQTKKEKQYEFHKVLNDIKYYRLNILLKKINYFI